MPDADALDRRLRAVERALTDDDTDLTDLRNAAELTREVETLSARLDEVDERLDELDAATQALRGYVGNVRAVNESVERRADAALAKAESLETALDAESAKRPERPEHPERDPTDDRARSERPCGCETARTTRSTPSECTRAAFGVDKEVDDATPETDERGLLARIAERL